MVVFGRAGFRGARLSAHASTSTLAPSRAILSAFVKRPSVLASLTSPRAFSTSPRSFDASSWIPSIPSVSTFVPSVVRGDPSSPPAAEPSVEASTSAAAVSSEVPSPLSVSPPVPESTPAATTEAVSSTPDISITDVPTPDATHFITSYFDTSIPTGSLDLTSLASSWGLHPIMRLESLFLNLHEHFPLVGYVPWYVLIPTVTVFLRLALFPFTVRAQQNAARMAKIQPEMLKGMAKVKEAKAVGDVMREQMATMEVQTLMKANKVNPIRNIIFPIIQGGVFMTTFFSLRGLSGSGIQSLHTEGAAWFTDLAAADPYYVLPIASTALTLATIELGVDATTQVQTTTTKNMKLFFRAGLIFALPFIAYFPAAILVYWTTNNALSLIQAFILRTPAIRTLLNIPLLPKKALPGEKGYVPEPSFGEAFRSMQNGFAEKWEETREKADKARDAKEALERETAPAEVYVPRAPMRRRKGAVESYAEGLTESMGSGAGEIVAQSKGSRKEDEKAKRILKARMKRNQMV
ncbi:YidC/Oxa1 family membrane protein insertase, partial [Phenoliferia sp. Uapishka_3]